MLVFLAIKDEKREFFYLFYDYNVNIFWLLNKKNIESWINFCPTLILKKKKSKVGLIFALLLMIEKILICIYNYRRKGENEKKSFSNFYLLLLIIKSTNMFIL